MQNHYRGRTIFLAMLLGCFFTAIPAQADKNFIYESARTLGMGGTSVAIADDHQALFTNPAGLGL